MAQRGFDMAETRLYVGNLPYSTTEGDLKQLFSQAGTVESVTMPIERETGRPRGFAFVQMANEEDANRAIRLYNNYMLDGRTLRVSIAKEREMGRGRGYAG
jgi:RNA recognition motif-containing protein